MHEMAKYSVLLILDQILVLRQNPMPKLWRANRPLRERHFWAAFEPVAKLVVHVPVLATMFPSQERLLGDVLPQFTNRRQRSWRWQKCLARLLVRQSTFLGRRCRIPSAGQMQRRVAHGHAAATTAKENICSRDLHGKVNVCGSKPKKLHDSNLKRNGRDEGANGR